MSKLIRACPECHQDTAVHLGEVPGLALYACVECDAEFQVSTDDDD